jgi:hypothetical protein
VVVPRRKRRLSQIILDMGSGNTCRNDIVYARRMIDAVKAIDTKKHQIILKWQLEKEDPPGQKKLDREVFREAYKYGKSQGYLTTSSVFDKESLDFLMSFRVPFIKIACNSNYGLMDSIPSGIVLYVSFDPRNVPTLTDIQIKFLVCIPEYPAKLSDYPEGLGNYSDHAPGLELWNREHPEIWEKHFVLERDPSNPDSGVFALTPDQLKEIL